MLRSLQLERCGYALAVLVAWGCADAGKDSEALDPSFDNWCDRNLCDWTTRQGQIAKVSTWHESDLGVSFVETPTEISQLLKLNAERAPCLLFDTIADVAPEADVSILIDFNDDGIPDDEQQVAVLRWKSVPFSVRAPVAYENVRVSVIKRGEGRAVLALMRVVSQSNCSSSPLPLDPNSKCSQDAVCSSGRCLEGRCTSLTPSASSE
jgi:hypothetical protein